MKAYISVSFGQRTELNDELIAISDVLSRAGMQSFIFVDNYGFQPAQEKPMMQQVMADINQCDFLIAETSYKAIGVGIEAGYAKAKNKPVIYLRRKKQRTFNHDGWDE